MAELVLFLSSIMSSTKEGVVAEVLWLVRETEERG